MSSRKSYHHGDLRQELLNAGDQVLMDLGFRGFTLRECARRAGVSHAAPKHHFGDARGFLTELAGLAFERLHDRLEAAMNHAGSLEAEFQAISLAYVRFAQEFPEHFRLMFRCDLLDTDSPTLAVAAHKTLTRLSNVILRQRGEPEKTVEDYKPPTTAIINDIVIGWCHVHGFAHLLLERQLSMMAAGEQEKYLLEASARLSGMLRSEAHNKSS
ncbi:MAG: TetR/AcrR family transcriptional regulator [Pseudomonadales bacterium]|nr:TetR/AcrR family transcriptional regulator [Pseudomonadales bacterium]